MNLGPGLKVRNFYFDQSLLVLQLLDSDSGLDTHQFFTYYENEYIHLNAINSDAYLASTMVIDDEQSKLQKYRVAITGRTTDGTLQLQVRMIDLVRSVLDEGRANLSSLK